VQEFHIDLIGIALEKMYLMRLFFRSLTRHALEWFSHLPMGIQTFDEIANKFITHFYFNIENNIAIATLCQTKKEEGENFITFFKIWRILASWWIVKLP
jgi:hypothetical protein